ncbi:MAG: hypothetical protein ACLT98_09445 [Eggerthellaceae bacterium]
MGSWVLEFSSAWSLVVKPTLATPCVPSRFHHRVDARLLSSSSTAAVMETLSSTDERCC